jgi:hypothetical protein
MFLFIPFIVAIFVLGLPWWLIFPAFFVCGGACSSSRRHSHYTHTDETKRKRKNEEFEPIPQTKSGDYEFDPYTNYRRRVVQTRDGRYMTALEDPETGRLILEDNM